jgi:uncharacterized protein (DUF952 family)
MSNDLGSPPSTVFKIFAAQDWAAAETTGAFAGSADDVRDGFIHLSTALQIEGTLQKHFSGQAGLLLVAFDAASLAPNLMWEPSRGGDLFPHYYGALPVDTALWHKALRLGTDGLHVIDKDIL